MRRKLLLSGILMFAMAAGANAQWRRFGPGDYGRPPAPYRGGGLIDRVLRDVDSVRPYEARRERHHSEQARKDLMRFQDRWFRGHFDKGRLDSAIEHIDHIASSRYLDPRDRRIIERDLWDLREFRERGRDNRRYDRGWRPGW